MSQRDVVFWKRLFSLPTEPVWYLSILYMNYTVIFYTLAVSVSSCCVDDVYEDLDLIMYNTDVIYLIDIILNVAILYMPTLNLQEWNPTFRPIYILAFEIISLFPCKLILPLFDEEHHKIYCLITLIRLLRLGRIIYFHARFGRMSLTYYMRMFEFIVKLGLCMLASYSLVCNILCWNKTHEKCTAVCPRWLTLVRILSKLTSNGLRITFHYETTENRWMMYLGLVHYLSFLLIVTVAAAHITVGMKDAAYFSFVYMNMFKSLYKARLSYNVSQRLLAKTYNFFKVGWMNYGGLDTGEEFYSMLTPALSSEMMLDVCWPTFKHSNLFRSADLAFLRCLALVTAQEFVMPGDFIYRKGDWKDKIMYLVDGTIEILSEEDGESAILSLGSGTCLGEACIVLSYPSVNCVRAKTFCEFHVFDKKAFLGSYRRYPENCKEVSEQIVERIESAKRIHEVSELLKRRSFPEQRDVDTSTIYWLKNTLHKLMSTSAEMAFRHEFQNIYLVDEIDRRIFERLVFTASFLDMLAIKERVSTDSDPIFVRTKFPFILQPRSVVTVTWEFFIVLLTLVVSFLVPYASFLTVDYVPGYTTVIYIVSIAFLVDLMIQCCTAIKTPKVQYITFLSISMARLQGICFWADILSCLPFEMYTPVVLSELTPYNNAMMHLNKVTKIWRIERLFTNWTNQFDVNVLYITCAKLILLQGYLCYIVFALLVYFEGSQQHTTDILFDVIQVMTTVGLVEVRAGLNLFYMMTQIIAVTFKCFFISKISALYLLSKIGLLRIQNKAYRIVSLIKTHNLPKLYLRRLKNSYECYWEWDLGRSCHQQPKFMADLSTVNYSEVIDYVFGTTIRNMKFFSHLPNNSFLSLIKCMKMITRPSNETIIYSGDIMRKIQIFCKGSLDVLDADGYLIETIDSPELLNLVDILLQLPATHTFVTRTMCTFVQIEQEEFERFLLKYPEVNEAITDVKASLKPETDSVRDNFDYTRISGVTPKEIYKNVSRSSFYLFGYQLKADSFEEYDYFLPFDRLYPFDFIRYLLMRFTILPNGYFIYWWEGFRAAMAIISAIVHFVNPLTSDMRYRCLFYSLYAYGVMDIYVRLHVCYYDKKGILIKHPLKTAKYYLTHGFFVDFLALVPANIGIGDGGDYVTFFVSNSVRLLPLGRYWQYMQTLKFSVIVSESKFIIILYAPLIVVLINLMGCFMINVQCESGPKVVPHSDLVGFTCINTSFLIESYFHKPINEVRAHFYGMYFAASFLLLYGLRGYRMVSHGTRLAASLFSFIGQGITFAIMAKVICIYSSHKTFLSEQQAGMGRLKRFMESINVSKRLTKVVVDTFEVNWKVTKGRTIHSVMGPFSSPMRRDFYYEMYGSRLLASSPFQKRSPVFYRNILEYLTLKIIPKGGYLSTINDIEDTTYILLSGIADILSPDGTKLTTITEGAIFGNLQKETHVRICISVVAITHVELFSIKSTVFYNTLEHYPSILEEYLDLREIYFTYIPSKRFRLDLAEYSAEEETSSHTETIDLCQAHSPHGLKVKIWTFLVVSYCCYFSILVDFYHMASGDFSINILIMMYTSDVLYVVYFLMLDRLAYEDARGYLVIDLMKIKKRLRDDRLRTWISIISIFPMDVFILSSNLSDSIGSELYTCSRLNRALRLIHVIDYFSYNIDKVDVKFVALKVAALICWTTVFLVTFASVLTMVACRHEINLNPPVPPCKEINSLPSSKKITFFLNQIHLAIHILTVTASSLYYPHAEIIILWFVCSFVVGMMLQTLVYGQVFALYNDLSLQKTLFKRRLDRLFYFMDREDISVSLVTRVKKYIQLIWMTTSGETCPKLLNVAPVYLREAIMNSAFGHLITKHPVFSKCHPDCLRQIVQKCEVHYFFSDDYVQFRGSIDESMYFVFSGSIMVVEDDYSREAKALQVLQSGEAFGIKQGLFRRTPHLYSYRCKRYSIIIRLHLDRWEYLLPFFPATKHTIYEEVKKYIGW